MAYPGSRSGLLRIDVYPLVITRRVGEQVDFLLRDRPPIAVAEMLADVGLETRDPFVDDGIHQAAP